MTAEVLFLNGVYESVLKGIIDAQKGAEPDEIFYLQPYKSHAIAKLRENPPTACKPTTLYLSTTDKLSTVSYRAKIVGWKDKTGLDGSEWAGIDREIRRRGYEKSGLYDFDPPKKDGKRMVNLLCIQELVKLESPFSVSCLIKIGDGKPLSDKRTTSGGWSYVKLPG
ncbi:MAG: hypothetical protein OXO50_15830 [Caldilineaceae bacterium]|nr:hypothetical protein [Caldilineaceae bacterium]